MHAAKADQVEQDLLPLGARLEAAHVVNGVRPAEAELRLLTDRRDVLHGGEGAMSLFRIGHVRVEEREVKLHVQRLFVELTREVHARLWGVDVPVQVEDEVIGHDRVARREEGDEAVHQVPLGVRHLRLQVADVRGKVDLLDRPRVLDRRAVHLVKARVGHRPEGETQARVEQSRGGKGGGHWHASHVSAFSSEQATAAASTAGGGGVHPGAACGSPSGLDAIATGASTVAFAMRVAGRERR